MVCIINKNYQQKIKATFSIKIFQMNPASRLWQRFKNSPKSIWLLDKLNDREYEKNEIKLKTIQITKKNFRI